MFSFNRNVQRLEAQKVVSEHWRPLSFVFHNRKYGFVANSVDMARTSHALKFTQLNVSEQNNTDLDYVEAEMRRVKQNLQITLFLLYSFK